MTLQEQLEKLMSETGTEQSDVAKGIGQSDALVSQWRKGVYKGNNAKVDEAIANFIHREQRNAKSKIWKLCFAAPKPPNVFGHFWKWCINHAVKVCLWGVLAWVKPPFSVNTLATTLM